MDTRSFGRLALIISAALLSACGAAAAAQSVAAAIVTPPPQYTVRGGRVDPTYPISHIVVIIMENRSVDDLFESLPGANTILNEGFPGCLSTGPSGKGAWISLVAKDSLLNTQGFPHTHVSFLRTMYPIWNQHGALGPLSGALPTNQGYDSTRCIYVPTSANVLLYYHLAEKYSFSDAFFAMQQGPSFPAHMWLDSGTSACTGGLTNLVGGSMVSKCTGATPWMASDNPGFCQWIGAVEHCTTLSGFGPSGPGGCSSPTYTGPLTQQTQVNLMSPSDTTSYSAYWVFPCFKNPSIFWDAAQHSLTWKSYRAGTYGYGFWENGDWDYKLWCSPDSAPCAGKGSHTSYTCGTTSEGGTTYNNVCYTAGSGYTKNISATTGTYPNPCPIGGSSCLDDSVQFVNDINAGHLANITYFTPADDESDHPTSDADGWGPIIVTNIINAIGNSSFWNSTEIIVVWDDWGGNVDHVCPMNLYTTGSPTTWVPTGTAGATQCNSSAWTTYTPGYRVPFIMISPYVRTKYISHTAYNFCSILLHIEDIFSLPKLSSSSCDNGAPDFTKDFTTNYSASPHPFTSLANTLPPEFLAFINGIKPDLSGPADRGPDDTCEECILVNGQYIIPPKRKR